MDFTTSALIASWAAILLLALVVSGLVRQVHQLSRTQPQRPGRVGLTPGADAPGLAGVLEPGRPGVLLFLDADCRTCAYVLGEAGAWSARHGSDAAQVRALYAGAAPSGGDGAVSVLPVLPHRADLFEAYDAIATPFAVATDAEGRVVRSEPLGSATALLHLLDDLHPGQLRSTP
ncbi:hypothetical protein AB0M28_10080 [Streptomyces sp. NPDC051940]|uniref:hypothetical protein n=1 Tax=Streptomyces sp. NPDC051940 TaxID=3155675 RepID=UPI0034451D89